MTLQIIEVVIRVDEVGTELQKTKIAERTPWVEQGTLRDQQIMIATARSTTELRPQ